jgi:hypothetical protein
MTNTLQLDRIPREAAILEKGARLWEHWKNLATNTEFVRDEVNIVLVGKYVFQSLLIRTRGLRSADLFERAAP